MNIRATQSRQQLGSVSSILLAFTIGFSVFGFGATTTSTRWFSHFLLCMTVIAIVADLLIHGGYKRIFCRRLLLLCIPIVLLMGQGILMVYNAKSDHSMVTWQFEELVPLISDALPGSIVRTASRQALWLQFVLLVATWMLAVQFRSDRRLRIAAATIGAIGVAFAILGISQRLLGVRSIYGMFERPQAYFFGSFRSHANAGTFILLSWPFCAAFMLRELRHKRPNRRVLAFFMIGSALLLMSLFINVSRAAQVIGVMSLFLFALFNRRQLSRLVRKYNGSLIQSRVLRMLCVGILSICSLIGMQQSMARWAAFTTSRYWPLTNTARWQAYVVAMDMVRDAGWFGFGPGAFRHLFPYYTNHLGDSLAGVWWHTHQDYLQVWMEWGTFGALCWAMLCFGALAMCGRFIFQRNYPGASDRMLIERAVFVAMLGFLLHALVDFPFQIYSLQLIFMVTTAMAWSCKIDKKSRDTASTEERSEGQEG